MIDSILTAYMFLLIRTRAGLEMAFSKRGKMHKFLLDFFLKGSVAEPDPDPPDPHVFGPPGSGSTSQRYGSGSFYHHAKK